MKVKNLARRPIELNFSNGPQRLAPNTINYVSETDLSDNPVANSQLNVYVSRREIVITERGIPTSN